MVRVAVAGGAPADEVGLPAAVAQERARQRVGDEKVGARVSGPLEVPF
jgi:hypothetical protein